jgi:hypothetical protein
MGHFKTKDPQFVSLFGLIAAQVRSTRLPPNARCGSRLGLLVQPPAGADTIFH